MSATRCKEGKKRKQIRKREKEWKDGKKSKSKKGRIVKVKKEGEQKQKVKVKEYKREDDRHSLLSCFLSSAPASLVIRLMQSCSSRPATEKERKTSFLFYPFVFFKTTLRAALRKAPIGTTLPPLVHSVPSSPFPATLRPFAEFARVSVFFQWRPLMAVLGLLIFQGRSAK
jgi:hypothetical protein